MFEEAFWAPWPPYVELPPSRSLIASFAPVDAPDGTMARKVPESV